MRSMVKANITWGTAIFMLVNFRQICSLEKVSIFRSPKERRTTATGILTKSMGKGPGGTGKATDTMAVGRRT